MNAAKFLFKIFLFASIVWFALIMYALFFYQPASTLPMPKWQHFDKLVHICLFFTQTLLIVCIWGVRKLPIPLGKIFIFICCLGIVSELTQAYFTTNRSGDVHDFIADTFGCLVALAVAKLYFRPQPAPLKCA